MKNVEQLLAKWMNGELSEEELEQLRASAEYKELKPVLDAMDGLDTPPIDIEALLAQFHAQQDGSKSTGTVPAKRGVVKWLTITATAAAVALLGIFVVAPQLQQGTTLTTAEGKQLNYELPDGSTIQLNENSSASFNPKKWEKVRAIKLSGEAFFNVEKGDRFLVNTTNGTVEVLGTSFTVNNRGNEYSVDCYSGTVRVKRNKEAVTIEGGEKVFLADQKLVEGVLSSANASPGWLEGGLEFDAQPLSEVLKVLKTQFGLSFVTENVDLSRRFSGVLATDDEALALKLVFESMNLSYERDGQTVTVTP